MTATPTIFDGLTEADRARVAAAGSERTFAHLDVLLAAGDAGRDLFVLLDGSAVVVAEDEKLLAVLGTGDTFGELGWLLDKPRTASVVAQSDGRLLVLPAAAMDSLMAQHPAVAARLLHNLLREMAARIVFTTEMALL